MAAVVSRRPGLLTFRVIVFLLAGVFFFVPLLAMFEFATRAGVSPSGPRTLANFSAILSYPELVAAIIASLQLAVITSVAVLALLVPTMVWVRLRLPGLSRVIEFICLLPLTIPPIVLIVGLVPVYKWVWYYVNSSILSLSFAYLILVLPYTYRALDAGLSAINVKTLSEAARSLGAGWFTVMWQVIVPNIRSALLNAALLSVALVLGEFTFANLLNYYNVQVEINHLGRLNAGVSIAVAVSSLLFAFVLLVLISFAGRNRQGKSTPATAIGQLK
jgi:putative spermidine/putrescine transport system permease protein